MKFIDPKTDFAFKRIFGSNDSQDALISFINAALNLRGKRQVESVEIKNPYQEKNLPIEKGSIVDIACVDGNGVEYLVEMQVEKVQGFANRMIYNLSKCYSGQLVRGEDYPALHDVVLIAVMDFALFDDLPSYRSLFVMTDVETRYAPFNQLRLCCLELAKFKKQECELSEMLDKWAYFLKETGHLEVRPKALESKVFDNAFEKAQAANLSRKEKDAYDASVQEARDKRGMVAEGEAKGLAKGLAEGLAKGRAEGKAKEREEMALNMLKNGAEIDFVCKCTGFSAESVRSLQQQLLGD